MLRHPRTAPPVHRVPLGRRYVGMLADLMVMPGLSFGAVVGWRTIGRYLLGIEFEQLPELADQLLGFLPALLLQTAWVLGRGRTVGEDIVQLEPVVMGGSVMRARLLKLLGGLFLVGIGLHTWRQAAVALEAEEAKGPGAWRDFLSTFAITITNPGTMMGVAGVCVGLGAAAQPVGLAQSWQLVAGVFVGSALWWAVLTEMTILVRARFTPERMRTFNHVSGTFLMLLGLAALISLMWA